MNLALKKQQTYLSNLAHADEWLKNQLQCLVHVLQLDHAEARMRHIRGALDVGKIGHRVVAVGFHLMTTKVLFVEAPICPCTP